MKRLTRLKAVVFAVAVVVLATAFPTPAKAEVSFGFSYSSLSPHGSWHVSSQHGRVWRPRIAVGEWNPYYDGHWVYTDLGWTWVSDYSWGNIPYHYGTWVIEPGIGWVWIPGRVWAPSWVVFCHGPDYIGWAPVPPRYSVGLSVGFGDIGYDRFVVVRSRDFLGGRVRNYAVPRNRSRVIINNTRIVNRISIENNIVINRGPDVRIIERDSGRKIRATRIERVERAGPGRRFDREEIRVRPERGRRPRAAEPVSSRTPLPSGDRDRDRDRDRDGDRDRDRGSDRYDKRRGDDDGRQRSSTEPIRRDTRERPSASGPVRDTRQQPSARGPAPATRQQPSARGPVRETREQPSARGPVRDTRERPSARGPVRDTREQTGRPSAAPARKKAPVPQQPPSKQKSKKPKGEKEEDTK